jgi:hypothetical protein
MNMNTDTLNAGEIEAANSLLSEVVMTILTNSSHDIVESVALKKDELLRNYLVGALSSFHIVFSSPTQTQQAIQAQAQTSVPSPATQSSSRIRNFFTCPALPRDRTRHPRKGDVWRCVNKARGTRVITLAQVSTDKKSRRTKVLPENVQSTGSKKTLAKWIALENLYAEYELVKKG